MKKYIVLTVSALALVIAMVVRIAEQEEPEFRAEKNAEVNEPFQPGGETERLTANERPEGGKRNDCCEGTLDSGGDAGGLQRMGPPSLFPTARVISSVAEPLDSKGRQRVIETLETSMEEPFVRLERTILHGPSGGPRLEEQVAMVANQILLERPEGLGEDKLVELLKSAGAVEVKEVGEEAYLATFVAQPSDPRALEIYIARVRKVAGVELTIQPNYIRKLF